MLARFRIVGHGVRYLSLGAILLGLLSTDGVVRAQPAAEAAPTGSSIAGPDGATAVVPQRRSGSQRSVGGRTPVRTARASSAGENWTSPRGAAVLAADLDAILGAHTRGGQWGVIVTSVSRGDTLFSHDADALLKPASILKLMTTGLALDRFGADHRFETRVLRDGRLQSGVLDGNLYLRGGGDPSLSLRFWESESPMDALARQIADAGIREVHGAIVADESAFVPERIPEGWKTTYLGSAYAAPVSALSLNENVVWVVARVENGNAVVELEPASTAIPVESTVRAVAGSGGRIIARRTDSGISVSGTIGKSSAPRKYSLVVNEPPAFAAGALEASLRKAGVQVTGGVRAGVAPDGAAIVARVSSIPMAHLVSYMNRESINHFAELLYRNAALENGEAVSAASALAALREFLTSKTGARAEDVRVRDGSGLSEADSLTARSMVHLLAYAHKAPWGPVFHASMPVAGESELMRRRMRGTPAQGNLHAKTGTTNSVVSLTGYVTAMNGEVLAFVFIYNGADRWNARTAMDLMGPTLANFHRD
jgi:D-alanyl-D-alanine carboxypeptidase/D-alanyl-D-alanine-endopeptidase (penicillin-binding protein 4)